MPRTRLAQLIAVEYAGRERRVMAKMITRPPTIQELKALGNAATPYIQGEIKNHMPASRVIVLAALAAPNAVEVRTGIVVLFICSRGVM